MRCFYHPSEPAVAKCEDCQKYLCHSCATKYSIPICDSCNQKRIEKERFSYIKIFVISFILFVIGYNFENSGSPRLVNAYATMSVYNGWIYVKNFRERRQSRYIIVDSSSSYFAEFLIMLFFSFLIGVVITPFALFRYGRRLLEFSKSK